MLHSHPQQALSLLGWAFLQVPAKADEAFQNEVEDTESFDDNALLTTGKKNFADSTLLT